MAFIKAYEEAHKLTLTVSKAGRIKLHRSHLMGVGVVFFVVGIVIVGERFTFAVVIARLVDALGDVAFDRGMPEMFHHAAEDAEREVEHL